MGMKRVFKQQYLQMCGVKLNKYQSFSATVVERCSETQPQVAEKFKLFNLAG